MEPALAELGQFDSIKLKVFFDELSEGLIDAHHVHQWALKI